MDNKIRFSQHVIDCLNDKAYRYARDSYGGSRVGFYQKDKEDEDCWELWAWKDWPWGAPHISLKRKGKYLNNLTKDEKKDLWEAMKRANEHVWAKEAERAEQKRRKLEADHWWP